jgi:outer membrane protein OmpA-like peptidoglycan-associated protein
VSDHERLAAVMAPIVVACIRTEIQNSRDLMVDALYPITGRLVAAAVRSAFRDLIETLNAKVDQSLSIDLWKTRLKAKLTGRSEAEIILEQNVPLRIDEIFLIHRATGLLIARESANDDTDGETDRDIVASILTAIMAFVRDAFDSSGESELNSFSFGDSQLYLRTSPAVILGARATGTAPAGFERALDATFAELLDAWGGALANYDGSLEDDIGQRLQSDLRGQLATLLEARDKQFRSRSNKGMLGGVVVLALLAAWVGYEVYDSYRIQGIGDTARSIVSAEERLRGYPTSVRFDPATDRLVLEGLTPHQYPIEGLRKKLTRALPGVELDLKLYAPARAATMQTEALSKRFQVAERILQRRLDALDQRLGSVDARVAGLDVRLSKEKEFEDWINRQAIYFADGVNFHAPTIAESKLKKLVELFAAASASSQLVVIGYSDSSGSSTFNRQVSQARSDAVAMRLMGLGIPGERILAIGRGQDNPLSRESGPSNKNRRVEFEIRPLRSGDVGP